MKKYVLICIAALLALPFFSGCAGGDENVGSGKLKVYTSFYPMYDFTSKIAGDRAAVVNLTPFGGDPHDYEPYPADIAALEKADVFVYSGAGMEHWVDKVLKTLKNKELVVVEASAGIELIGDDGGHDHEDGDPHVWLSPENAKIQMKNIKDALVKADPGNRDEYEANYALHEGLLDGLDLEFSSALLGLGNKTILVSHKAFGYLCRDYGLTQLGIRGLSSQDDPDPARMAELVFLAREHGITTVFFEELASPKVALAIANEIGAKTAVLNPLEGLGEGQMANGDDYYSVMRQNLAALKDALR